MNRTAWWIAIGLGLGMGVGGGWIRSQSKQARMQAVIEQLQGRNRDAARRSEAGERAAEAQASLAELQRLRDDREAVAQLRREIELLKQRAGERARERIAHERAQRAASKPLPPEPERSMLEELLPAELWRNRGRATPSDTMETALWAAAGGDVAGLADMLELGPAARSKAAALLTQLPDAMRAQYATPEQLVALLAVQDVPLGQAMIIEPKVPEGAGTYRVVQIMEQPGKVKNAFIALNREGEVWRLVVPESAVDGYASKLKSPLQN